MSDSFLHKNKGKFNNGFQDKIPQNLQNHFNRHNNELGEFKDLKNKLIDKIAEKETKEQIRVIEKGEYLDYDGNGIDYL